MSGGRIGGIYFQHRQDAGISVEPNFGIQFIDPPAMDAGVTVFQFSGKLKGVVDFIIALAFWVFANKSAEMI